MKRFPWLDACGVIAVAVAIALIGVKNVEGDTSHRILNVSYDPTRELYLRINEQFVAEYQRDDHVRLEIRQSHGGSSRQARSVIDGQQDADLVTLGLYSDIDALRKRGLISVDWASRLPHHSQPYYSTIVFVVRKGNPRNIRDWPDLIRPGVEVITPDPKTSANGKLSALAAWGAVTTRGGTDADARAYLAALYQHAGQLDAGARGAATTFTVEKIGDVQLTWENEALREAADTSAELEIVYPPVSILAEPYVAWVDANVARHHSERYARAYLEFLFTPRAQEIMAKSGYRPVDPGIATKYASQLRPIALFNITSIAKDWDDANRRFFEENGVLDTVTANLPQKGKT
jgi:sulfate/thiosulfate transport system substrate-binding protein